MPDRPTRQTKGGDELRSRWSMAWPLPAAVVAGAAIAVCADRLVAGYGTCAWVVLAAVAAGAVIAAFGWGLGLRTPRPPASDPASLLHDVLDSAGPLVMAVGLDGRFAYVNPATERMLGYFAEELLAMPSAGRILPTGRGERLVREILKVGHGGPVPADIPAAERLAAYMDAVCSLPPSQIPSFETQLRRKDGGTVPVTLHISALRGGQGELHGLVAVALDHSAVLRQEQVLRESQERYRDLFENSSDMIATLSPGGKFLYANPAWKRCLGLESAALQALGSFEEVFGVNCRDQVRSLFRRALDGEAVNRALLWNYTADGRALDLELSLSQRQKAGKPLAVRCLLRDVTQQKQREKRLALQLAVSQILAENISPENAAARALEALCVSQNWDAAFGWELDPEEKRLELRAAWGTPGSGTDELIQQSMGATLAAGDDLPGEVWRQGQRIWTTNLSDGIASPRARSACALGMVSGWAVPVRVENRLLGVLEFYSHLRLREDREALASIETVAASLGQMVARYRERGRAEELSRQQEILLDSVADGICGLDRAGRVSFANPAAARLLGATVNSLTGKQVHELLHGHGESARECGEECPLRKTLEHRSSLSGEDTVVRSDGSTFPAEYCLTPILDRGRFSGSVLSFRDISQRYALDRMKDEFISTVSHELRTPLTSIRGSLGLLTSGILGQVNEKASNLLRIALSNSDRLVRLINDILDLERIQSGREPLAFSTVQLGEVVRQAIEGIQPMADAAEVKLIRDSTEVELSADPYRLIQVVTNLLSNAVKFSPAHSTISVMMHPGVSGVTLSVIDQGRGIPADRLESIFGRFQQVDASDSRQKGGTGLGLAICRTIVQQHSGRIWAERNSVKGSTFRVFLPYRPTVAPAAQAHDSEAESQPVSAER